MQQQLADKSKKNLKLRHSGWMPDAGLGVLLFRSSRLYNNMGKVHVTKEPTVVSDVLNE